jgi:hypothetical protein
MRNACVTLLLLAATQSHALTAADSGWKAVWNRSDFTEF